MAIEAKAAVAVDSLSNDEACDIFRLFGYEPESAERLYGGYASSNFKVVGRRRASGEPEVGGEGAAKKPAVEPKTLLLKINYYGLTVEDGEHQLFVMNHLRGSAFPTNYPHAAPDGSLLVESNGRRAMLLDFIPGTTGDAVLAREEAKAPRLLSELGAALARLHQVSWPEEPRLRDVRSGYAVCSTGDLLAGKALETLEADGRFSGHPFVEFARSRLEWLRELYAREVPWGLIHGDAFLDNTFYEDGPDGSGECRLIALYDWEDSCVGPFVLDLAVCASACCFTASNELIPERLRVLLGEYQAHRPLSVAERESFVDFMAAGALACGFYRFGEFNVRQPDSDAQAKDSFRIMFDRARLLLLPGGARDVAAAALRR